MNVLFLTHAFPRARGDPAGSFVLRLAIALGQVGITATVVAPHAPGLPEQDTLDGIAVRRFRYAPTRYETLAYTGTMAEQVRSSWAARAALAALVVRTAHEADRRHREGPAQLLHAHWWFPSGVAGAVVATARGLPLVTTLHGSDVRLTRTVRVAQTLFARVARRSSVLTAVSSWLAEEAHQLAPQVRAATVAPMPADVQLFSPGGHRSRDSLLFVGRLARQKGVDLLLRAMADLPDGVSVDIVGDGPDRDALRSLSGTLGLDARVRWHGPVPHPRLVDFYQASTALVVPSVDEGLGLVAVEAHLCGTPVVAFDSGGLPDVVVHGDTGILVRPLSAPALAGALAELLARADQGASLGAAGRARALSRFSPEAVAGRYSTVYQEAIRHFEQG